ncbi:MAG: hypothetical protein V3V99_09610 [candidate division Zixibacteria bacterium]
MNEKVRKSIVFGIFIIAVIWGYSNLSQRWAKKPQEQDIAKQQVAANTVNNNIGQNQAIPENQIIHDSVFAFYAEKPVTKNPFYHNRKRVTGKTKKIKLHLLGILYRQTNAQALINGRVLGVGDLISGYHVKNIARESVVLEKAGKTITLFPRKESL